ncbi:MAG: protein translocase subunit SecD, partial [Gammaproteobacteria bacterium]|nr:protein translocase subunit SecD [Gammaproteobacteria bacterium]
MLNQNSIWRYLMIVVVLSVALIYALPNIYPEDPSLQITATRGAEVSVEKVGQLEQALQKSNIAVKSVVLEKGQILARFSSAEDQLKAREVVNAELGSEFVTALNMAPATPKWLNDIGATPMKLGLDLRGGVHFLMEVDMKTAMDKNVNDLVQIYRVDLREAKIRYRSVTADLIKQQVVISFRNEQDVSAAKNLLSTKDKDMTYKEG